MKTPLILALAGACLLASAPAQAEMADAATLSALQGTYESAGAEPWYGGYGTREFVFANGAWSLTFIHALDPDMTMRTFQFRTGGSYTVGEESDAVPGAFRTRFNEDWKHLTLLTPDSGLAEAFGMGACGLTVNLEADISETGCAAWRPVAAAASITIFLPWTGRACALGSGRKTMTCAPKTRRRRRFCPPSSSALRWRSRHEIHDPKLYAS